MGFRSCCFFFSCCVWYNFSGYALRVQEKEAKEKLAHFESEEIMLKMISLQSNALLILLIAVVAIEIIDFIFDWSLPLPFL